MSKNTQVKECSSNEYTDYGFCPVCKKNGLVHDSELNSFHCAECGYQWWPSRDYSEEKRLITNRGKRN